MYTSTPLSPLPFSLLHHFLPLLSFLPVSPSAPPFPSYHPLFHPLSFYHPLLSLSSLLPCHFYLHLLPLSPLFPVFIPLCCFSLSFSPPSPLFLIILPLLYSPLFPWKFFSSICFLSFTLFCPFSTLSSNLCTLLLPLYHFSLHLSSPFSYLLFFLPFLLPSLLICPIHCLFLPLPSFLLPPLSFDTSPTCKIYLSYFFPAKAQTIPTYPLFTSTTFYKKLFSPLPTISTISPTHSSHTNNQHSNKQSTFPKTPYQISFPAKNATHANPLCTQNRFKRPKYPLPAPTTDTTQITNYSQNGQ